MNVNLNIDIDLSKYSQSFRRMFAQETDSIYWLERLAKDKDVEVRYVVSKNKYSNERILKILIKDEFEQICRNVAIHPNVTPEILDELSNHESWHVRRKVSLNFKTKKETLQKLVIDSVKSVRRAAKLNLNSK